MSQSHVPNPTPAPEGLPQNLGLNIGDKIDKYDIVAPLGYGGASVVWKGHDRLLNRHAAIKQILPTAGDRQSQRDRFAKEATLQKQVAQHDKHLVRVLDFLDDPRGLFLVMEFIDGQSLEQFLTSHAQPLDERQAVGIVGGVALALAAIHKHHIIHRDLKPSNILLPTKGGLKVTDFGLAAMLGDQDALQTGTVRYMAPELFADESEATPDTRADLYSLGVIAYEMLAGKEGFERAFKVVLRDQRNQALRWMKWHTNPRARATPLTELNPAINPAVAELVARLMEKDRDARIASATELLDAIRRIYGGGSSGVPEEPAQVELPGAAHIPSHSSAPTAILPRRSRTKQILMAVIAAQVILFAAIWFHRQGDTNAASARRRADAMAMFEQARKDREEERYEEAVAKFESLAKSWPNDPTLGKGSKMRSLWAGAQIALRDGRPAEAVAALDKIEGMGGFPDNRDLIIALRSQAQTKLSFAKITQDIDNRLSQGQIAEARQLYDSIAKLPLPDAEARLRDEIGQRIEGSSSQFQINRVIERGRRMAANLADRERALADLTRAYERTRSPEVSKLIDEINAQRRLDAATADISAAETSGNESEMKTAYLRFLEIKADDGVTRKLKGIESRAELREGRRLMEAGDSAAAAAAFTRSLGFQENKEAREELARIRSLNTRAAFIEAGNQAMAKGDYDSAVQQYDNAIKLGADDTLRRKHKDAQVRIEVRRGKQLLAQGRATDALTAFEAALAIDPADAEAKSAADGVKKRAEYEKFIAAGDALRAQGKFGDAQRAYHRARDINNTPAIQDRINDTEFDSLVAQARSFMRSEKWDSAKAMLKTASQMRPGSELIRTMLDEVEKKRPVEEES